MRRCIEAVSALENIRSRLLNLARDHLRLLWEVKVISPTAKPPLVETVIKLFIQTKDAGPVKPFAKPRFVDALDKFNGVFAFSQSRRIQLGRLSRQCQYRRGFVYLGRDLVAFSYARGCLKSIILLRRH